ncbi:tautomerase family protein [Dyadobacter sp. CY345]|uniref:tautomerase family protein n=1 Tax=Dyadobacter sp. CY345 TaxID=2909335 RepID=UPI001F486F33|nr:tautomerase family protein [Dyadobacter sp. CY345]MCF2447768.1 tautomerase family protein [Dyadobacter sp. CY345]
MGQVKVYGIRSQLMPIRSLVSDVLHKCIVEAFKYPENKRIHRFFYLDDEDFFYPQDRTNRYTIIEISLFEGRSVASKNDLYQLIFIRFEQEFGIRPNDVEITLTETPLHNWGIRGKSGDELILDYKVSV